MNVSAVLDSNFSFNGFYDRLSYVKETYGTRVHQYVCFYVATKLSTFRDTESSHWSLDTETKYSEKVFDNLISKIIPSQNI